MSADPRVEMLAIWMAIDLKDATNSAAYQQAVESRLSILDRIDVDQGIYRVSLDAAIEAAAKHLAEADHGAAYWLEATEQTRDYWRNKLRSLVTAAVMGGAQ